MSELHEPAKPRFRRAAMLLLMLVAGTLVYFLIERGQHAMKPNAFASSPGVSKPLIDTVLSKHIVTATFSMG